MPLAPRLLSPGLLAALRCPRDQAELALEDASLRCTRCGARHPVRDGIPDFVTGAQTSTARWRAAQRYELAWWQSAGASAGARDRFRRAAEGIAHAFDALGCGDWRARVLHVGPAGLGEIHELPARERIAVEPLAIELAGRGLLAPAELEWVAAMGECLPFADASFSAALLPNVLDHVADPERLLDELARCLAPGAPLWLTGHVTGPLLAPWLRGLGRARLGYFAGHPFAFTATELRARVERAGFEVASEQRGAADDGDRTRGLRARVKRRVLASVFLLARRRSPSMPIRPAGGTTP